MRLALWIVGPTGSGKSTLIERAALEGFEVMNPDVELEAAAAAAGLSLVMAEHDEDQAVAFRELRARVASAIWARVAEWRAAGRPIVFETTGDKPHLFGREVETLREAGYTNIGFGLMTPLATCLARDRGRRRVVGDATVDRTWNEFHRNLEIGVYDAMFGAGHFHRVG